MTLLEQATLYNALGVACILGLALLVGRTYPSAFFQNWTRAYTCGLGILLVEFAATHLGRPTWLVLSEIALTVTVGWFFVQTGRAIRGQPLLVRRWYSFTLGAALIVGGSVHVATGMFLAAFAPFVLVYAGLHIWLGLGLVRAGQERGASYLGFPLIGSGIWFFTFPFVEGLSVAWFGYMVSAILNLLVGVGMILFPVEDTAQKLRVKNEELAKLDNLKTVFMNLIGHEFKTPLTVITMSVYLLRRGGQAPLTDFQEEQLTTLQGQTDLLDRLLNDILDFSRLETGGFRMEKEWCDLNRVAEKAAATMAQQFQVSQVSLECHLLKTTLTLYADAQRLTQVLLNLLSNALRFTPAGGKVVLKVEDMPDFFRVSVADTGVGIALEHQEHVFKRFYQVEPGAAGHKGMGLGLAICRAIVEEGHGGRLSVASEPGKGSQFFVDLPRNDPQNGHDIFGLTGKA